eukprot:CAMPEP_0184753876 /NCGR_PEP_ID=MMETSP0315-20130426/44330_1 /TAXON_ID=101924 /ORGANISM="Rhodosorus marinus, Strain UTEX LB 2760" /LENGTH=66 /DNA_ID=CAMNT_0027233269 /DNA_START=101 /DNA_END=301 /DNA_ORIENTATION=-
MESPDSGANPSSDKKNKRKANKKTIKMSTETSIPETSKRFAGSGFETNVPEPSELPLPRRLVSDDV